MYYVLNKGFFVHQRPHYGEDYALCRLATQTLNSNVNKYYLVDFVFTYKYISFYVGLNKKYCKIVSTQLTVPQ